MHPSCSRQSLDLFVPYHCHQGEKPSSAPVKRVRLENDDEEGSASNRLREYISGLVDRGEHYAVKLSQVVANATEECDLEDHAVCL